MYNFKLRANSDPVFFGLFWLLGNKELLAVHAMWKSLLNHYQELGCVVNENSWP